jgi:hypothetical protein
MDQSLTILLVVHDTNMAGRLQMARESTVAGEALYAAKARNLGASTLGFEMT